VLVVALTQDRLKQVLHYDPETGVFTWKVRRGRQAAGKPAGRTHPHDGRVTIGVDGVSYYANVLAWLYVHGIFPEKDVDHRDGDPFNNRIANLRKCTHSQNQKNMRRHRDGASGPKGVYWAKGSRCWMSQIYADGKCHYLGLFATKEGAAKAYNDAALVHHGEFARFN